MHRLRTKDSRIRTPGSSATIHGRGARRQTRRVRPALKEGVRHRRMMSSTTTQRERHLEPVSSGGSIASGLLDREELLQTLDRALTKRITVISAPPGSGKTSLLRAWADHSSDVHRVGFVSVDRDQQDAQRFWSAVVGAIRRPAPSIDPHARAAAPAALDGERVVDTVLSEFDEQRGAVVLIIDDLHELKSPDAFVELEQLLARLPNSARVVLSSRRDPPIRLHRLRLSDELAEIRTPTSDSPRARCANCSPQRG